MSRSQRRPTRRHDSRQRRPFPERPLKAQGGPSSEAEAVDASTGLIGAERDNARHHGEGRHLSVPGGASRLPYLGFLVYWKKTDQQSVPHRAPCVAIPRRRQCDLSGGEELIDAGPEYFAPPKHLVDSKRHGDVDEALAHQQSHPRVPQGDREAQGAPGKIRN